MWLECLNYTYGVALNRLVYLSSYETCDNTIMYRLWTNKVIFINFLLIFIFKEKSVQPYIFYKKKSECCNECELEGYEAYLIFYSEIFYNLGTFKHHELYETVAEIIAIKIYGLPDSRLCCGRNLGTFASSLNISSVFILWIHKDKSGLDIFGRCSYQL